MDFLSSKYELVIGLEVHVELKTKSKMFCRCSADYFGGKPNTHTCPTCLGLPGALPTINEIAIKWCVLIGLALNCEIPKESKFDRKNYFYPDLPKGYQISQYDSPFCKKGYLDIEIEGKTKRIGIERVHQEEDTGKLIHSEVDGQKCTLIDFNRSGVPLVEIVTKPDFRSTLEVKIYLQKLQKIIRYLDVSDCDMEKGTMRLEPNISVRLKGQTTLPPYKVEVKNINSFKFVEKAIDYEVKRHIELLEAGEVIKQETRGYNEQKGITLPQRSKENAQDYRYFPEPDLPPIIWEDKEIEEIKKTLPEPPDVKLARFIKEYQLTPYDAMLLTDQKDTAEWFEEGVKTYSQTAFPGMKNTNPVKVEKSAYAKPLANWINGELRRYLNDSGKSLSDLPITPAHLSEMLYLIDRGDLSQSNAKIVFNDMLINGSNPSSIITQKGLTQITNQEDIEIAVRKAIKDNPKAVEDYKNGKEQALMFIIGQVMRELKGKGNIKQIEDILRRLI